MDLQYGVLKCSCLHSISSIKLCCLWQSILVPGEKRRKKNKPTSVPNSISASWCDKKVLKFCFPPKMLEQKFYFSPKMSELKTSLHPKCLNKCAALHPKCLNLNLASSTKCLNISLDLPSKLKCLNC